MCRLKGSHESQTTGILLICHELQRLLRLAFVGNVVIYCNSAINLVFFNAKPLLGFWARLVVGVAKLLVWDSLYVRCVQITLAAIKDLFLAAHV